MAGESMNGWTLDMTAAQIVRRYPHMLKFFDDLGVDDCCLDLDLRTIAAHHGIDPRALAEKIAQALQDPRDSQGT